MRKFFLSVVKPVLPSWELEETIRPVILSFFEKEKVQNRDLAEN